jgi:hypothetical protein
LPETLGDAGFVFTIPERYTAANPAVPTPREVAPWVTTIERLWDDPEFEAKHRVLAKTEARRWDLDRLADRYEAFLIAAGSGTRPSKPAPTQDDPARYPSSPGKG